MTQGSIVSAVKLKLLMLLIPARFATRHFRRMKQQKHQEEK
jgi:hypothetical protein